MNIPRWNLTFGQSFGEPELYFKSAAKMGTSTHFFVVISVEEFCVASKV